MKPNKTDARIETLLTVREVATALGCSPKTVHRRLSAGDLQAFRDGRLVRVHPLDLERYIKFRRDI